MFSGSFVVPENARDPLARGWMYAILGVCLSEEHLTRKKETATTTTPIDSLHLSGSVLRSVSELCSTLALI